MMNDAYVAGLFDGEGNIQFYKPKNHEYVHFRIAINQQEVLEQVRDFFGYGRVRPHGGKQWVFDVATYHESIDFVTRLLPYLLIKKAGALTALAHLRAHPRQHRAKFKRKLQ